jgi:hypothetical protein
MDVWMAETEFNYRKVGATQFSTVATVSQAEKGLSGDCAAI